MADLVIKDRVFNNAERQMIKHLMEGAGCDRATAEEEVAKYKREMAYMHEQQGNLELARHLLQELGEWDDAREEDYKNKIATNPETKIILPGEF